MFNDPKTTKDNYPRGIKGEPKLSALLSKIKAKKISYIFGEVNKGNLSEFFYIDPPFPASLGWVSNIRLKNFTLQKMDILRLKSSEKSKI